MQSPETEAIQVDMLNASREFTQGQSTGAQIWNSTWRESGSFRFWALKREIFSLTEEVMESGRMRAVVKR